MTERVLLPFLKDALSDFSLGLLCIPACEHPLEYHQHTFTHTQCTSSALSHKIILCRRNNGIKKLFHRRTFDLHTKVFQQKYTVSRNACRFPSLICLKPNKCIMSRYFLVCKVESVFILLPSRSRSTAQLHTLLYYVCTHFYTHTHIFVRPSTPTYILSHL